MDIIEALEAVVVSIKAWATANFDNINRQLDLLYKPITIKSFTNTVKTLEIGDKIKSGSLNWTLEKPATALSIDGVAFDVNRTSCTLDEVNAIGVMYNDYKSHKFTLTATDERGETATATTYINFTNRAYYGSVGSDVEITGAVVRGLTGSTLNDPLNFSFTATANAGERIIYALPSRNRTPVFYGNNASFAGGFFKMDKSVKVEGQSGYVEDYDIWLSVNVGLGTIPVKVT